MLPHKALAPDFEDDIFINYAHVDNRALLDDFRGFVDDVHELLKVRLEQLIGEEPKIWRDVLLEGTHQLHDTIFIRLSKTVFLVCVLSPSYIKSEWCRDELSKFYSGAAKNRGIKINNRSRIFKVVKTPIGPDPSADPVELSDLPEELRTVLRESLGYHFYELDKLTGRLREYSGEFGSQYRTKRVAKIDDLAQDIVKFISDGDLAPAIDKCVYLAETTPELSEERNEIRRDLLQHGYTVLPDENLPFEGAAFDEKVKGCLKRCIMSIHLIGSDFTTIQPEKEDLLISFNAHHQLSAIRVRKQHELAMTRAKNDLKYSRLIWMPGDLAQRDPLNQEFVAYLQNDPAVQENAEILSGASLEDLKTIMHQRLNTTWDEVKYRRVYLVCDRRDTEAVAPLKNYLQQHRCEVLLPFSDGDPVLRSHTENLRWCDAMLVFYGSVNTMEYKLAELRKVETVRDNRPLLAKGIYVGGVETDHKKTFATNEVLLMKCFGDFSPESIKPFLDQIEKGAPRVGLGAGV